MVKYVYTLGASGERIKVEELDRTVEYTYDELYRLTSETITEGKKVTTYTYAYDSVSNRTLKTVNGDETVYTYNSLNQLISENDTTYEYDNAGNLVRVIGSGKSALYEYNSENKLVKATVQQGNNVVVEEYTYDYEGNRTSKTTTTSDGNVEYIQYLNDNSSLTNVLVEIGSENVYYTVGADLISQEVDGEVYTYIYDGHGTVRALANEAGKITDTYSYDAFGNLLKSTGSTENSYLYCGEQYDSTTGLYYLRARYMDTSTGRFISMDTYQGSTADPISLHKYLYANSNPVMYTDPSGYCTLAEGQAVMIGIAAVTGIIVLDYVGVFRNLTSALLRASDAIIDAQIKISEMWAYVIIGINTCIAYTQRVLNDLATTVAPGRIEIQYQDLFGYVAWHVIMSIDLRGNKYGNDKELHHIVAQTAFRAAPARLRLKLTGIDVNDDDNLVLVKKSVHKFLHITEYYMWVNAEIKDAFSSAFWQNFNGKINFKKCEPNVRKRLIYMKGLISALDKMIP